MSELLLNKERNRPVVRPRELGAVACAGCPFAELGCPKQGSGDCPPPEVIEAKQAAPLLEDDRFSTVWATEGGYEGILQKPKERLKIEPIPITVPTVNRAPAPKLERPQQSVTPIKPVRRGQPLAEFIAELLLPTPKAK